MSTTAWDTFDREAFFAIPEPEPLVGNSVRDPLCSIPVGPAELDEDQSHAMSDAHPWHLNQPSPDIWHELWDLLAPYLVGVVVCNLDTGVNPHDVLPAPLAEESFIEGQSPRDGNGHGTHTASTSVAKDQLHGVAPGCQLLVAKVLSNGGSGSSSGIEAGLRWARQWRGSDGLKCDVRNLSLGGGARHAPTIDEIAIGFEKACLTNASAGNSGPSEATEGYPAKDPEVPSIGAYQENHRIAEFSSRGNITVACPGQAIRGASHRSSHEIVSMSGTSMACPFKTGVDALLIALRRASGLPQWRSMDVVVDVYKRYAIDAGAPGTDTAFGYGIPDVPAMITDMARFGREFFIKTL